MHLLVNLPPNVAISEFVNALKTNTARVLRRDHWRELARWYSEPVLWSRSYCAISVGGAPLEVLKHCRPSPGSPQAHLTYPHGCACC